VAPPYSRYATGLPESSSIAMEAFEVFNEIPINRLSAVVR
jgi:hypothetical protein